jgi:predicted dinucleotide-binding enzyme
MRIGVLGTGTVGRTLGTALVAAGHHVAMGSRTADNETAAAWAEPLGSRHGTYADAAEGADVLVNATPGTHSVEVLRAAGADQLYGVVVLDVSNSLDTSSGSPRLADTGGTSVAEQLQQTFPQLRVVKSLNTVNASVMVDPAKVPGAHTVFVAGDDADAKGVVRGLLGAFGWPEGSVLDLGGLSAAAGLEAYVLFWVATWQALGDPVFNIAVVRGHG